ncbi:MAG TPA: glycosyltransferase family 2 protein [Kofleriaceae bacterium]|nr:glycosyltransferase family 2 protein [Kofleriaceae bacterium]
MSEPLVTVVTPSLNQGRWIREAIESVLAQDYPRIEYRVLDGGSIDDTLDILRGYGDRVRWTSGKDGGQAQAIANGFAQTRGEIITWLNADDAYTPGAIRRAVEAFAAEPEVGLVFGHAEFIDADGRPLGRAQHVVPLDDRDPLLTLGDCVVQPAAFFRRTAYDAVGGLDPALHWTMDYDLWLRLARRCPARFLDHVFARVRIMPSTKTASGGWKRMHEIESVVRRHGGSALPAWFALEAAAMHARDTVASARQSQLRQAAASAVAAVRTLADPSTLAALASSRTWRIVRQRYRNTA